jgi:hypothetical protein
MTPDLEACVDRCAAAERAGDAAAALEWHLAVPMFGRGRHRSVLERLVDLGGDLPAWVRARWLAYQALRCEGTDSATGRTHRAALDHALHDLHDDLLAECFHEGGDPIQVMARVVGESWTFHHLFLFERRGLRSYLDEFFGSDPHDPGVELARRWAAVPLGGWRVGPSLPGGRLLVEDAASGEEVEVLDLGARSCVGADGCVLGRLVPSGVDDLPMFDSPPLAVPRRVAWEVAVAPEGPWKAVVRAIVEGRLASDDVMREDYELSTDVQELDIVRIGTKPRDFDRVMSQLRSGRDEVGRAAFRILRSALAGEVEEADAAFVAAASLNPHAHREARRRLVSAGAYDVWSRWAELVPEPGRRRLEGLGRRARDAS